NGIDDGLSVGADLVDVAVQIQYPSQRLLRRRDVIAFRTENDDRRGDMAKVHDPAVGCLDTPRGQIVADEELVDNELNLVGVEVDMPAPPALELQIAVRLGIDLGIDIVLLGPERVRGIHVLEILYQPRAVELAEIGRAHV